MNKLKNAGGMAAGVLMLLVFLALPIIFLKGATEFSLWALDWLPEALGIAVLLCAMLIPLAIIPSTRGIAAGFFGLASFVFGACLWLYGLAFTYLEWGMIGVVAGVLVFGVGVVITAALAAIFSGTWFVLGNLAFLFILFVGSRLLGAWLADLADQRRLRAAAEKAPSTVTIIQNSDG